VPSDADGERRDMRWGRGTRRQSRGSSHACGVSSNADGRRRAEGRWERSRGKGRHAHDQGACSLSLSQGGREGSCGGRADEGRREERVSTREIDSRVEGHACVCTLGRDQHSSEDSSSSMSHTRARGRRGNERRRSCGGEGVGRAHG
jgi:hypothetical protein